MRLDCFANALNGAQDQHQHPQRRRQIAHNSQDEMQAADRVQPPRKQQADVLHVALAPAPITGRVADQRRRHLLVTAAQFGGQINFPSGSAHEGRFHKIVAQNRPSHRFLSRQSGQSAVLDKRLDPDNRVVAPVIGRVPLPEIQSGDENGTVGMSGKLAHPSKKCVTIHRQRRGLDNAGPWMMLHQPHQVHQATARHDAVRVKDNHITVAPAPRLAKVGDITRFAIHILTAIPIENPLRFADRLPQIRKGHFLPQPDIRVSGVAEDEKLKGWQEAGFFEAFVGGLKPGEHPDGILVVNRHHHRGAGPVGVRQRR